MRGIEGVLHQARSEQVETRESYAHIGDKVEELRQTIKVGDKYRVPFDHLPIEHDYDLPQSYVYEVEAIYPHCVAMVRRRKNGTIARYTPNYRTLYLCGRKVAGR